MTLVVYCNRMNPSKVHIATINTLRTGEADLRF